MRGYLPETILYKDCLLKPLANVLVSIDPLYHAYLSKLLVSDIFNMDLLFIYLEISHALKLFSKTSRQYFDMRGVLLALT